jgi:hypothetical protein
VPLLPGVTCVCQSICVFPSEKLWVKSGVSRPYELTRRSLPTHIYTSLDGLAANRTGKALPADEYPLRSASLRIQTRCRQYNYRPFPRRGRGDLSNLLRWLICRRLRVPGRVVGSQGRRVGLGANCGIWGGAVPESGQCPHLSSSLVLPMNCSRPSSA